MLYLWRVQNNWWKKSCNKSLFKKLIMPILAYNLVIKTNHGLHLQSVKLVLNIWGNGLKVHENLWSLAFQWFGGSQKTIPTIAIFVLSIWQELTKRSINPLYTQIFPSTWTSSSLWWNSHTCFKELPDVTNENLDGSFEEQDDLNDNDFVPKSSEPILFN